MKKIYEAPELEILEIITEQPVFTVSDEEEGNSPIFYPGHDF